MFVENFLFKTPDDISAKYSVFSQSGKQLHFRLFVTGTGSLVKSTPGMALLMVSKKNDVFLKCIQSKNVVALTVVFDETFNIA